MNNRYKFFKDRLRAIAARTDREFDIQEMLWNCEMARLWLENHWKHLGKEYDLSYKQREKKAEWHIDFALLVANNAKWNQNEV